LNLFYRKKLDNAAIIPNGNDLEKDLNAQLVPKKLSNAGIVRFKLDLSYSPAYGKVYCSIEPNSSTLLLGETVLERDD